MAHVQLHLFVKGQAHGSRLRKRQGRRLAPVRPSRANELWYKAELLKLVRHIRQLIRDEVYPDLKAYVQSQPKVTDGLVGDAVPRRSLDTSLNRVAQRMGGIDKAAQRLADLAVQKNLQAVDERLTKSIKTSVSVDISAALTKAGPIQQAMAAATQANVELITSIPTQYLEKVGKAVTENYVDGMRWEDLAKVIEQVGDVTESRAKLIARDQTSKMNGSFNEARQTSLGIDQYIWQTSGDERVREEHAANDGKVFSWNEPPATGHPGEDINCRCVAVPYFDLDKMEEETFQ